MKNSILLKKADLLAKDVYKIVRHFPKEELYGLNSQLRRSILFVPLNIIEGYARMAKNEKRRFFEIAYASLKEAKYLLYFAFGENYLSRDEYIKIIQLAEEVAKILWANIKTFKEKC
jgi:four helix bundle protein